MIFFYGYSEVGKVWLFFFSNLVLRYIDLDGRGFQVIKMKVLELVGYYSNLRRFELE